MPCGDIIAVYYNNHTERITAMSRQNEDLSVLNLVLLYAIYRCNGGLLQES